VRRRKAVMIDDLGGSGPRVFVSYAGEDRDNAIAVTKELQGRLIDAQLDTDTFPPGGVIVQEIGRKLRESDYFLLLWSRHAKESAWVDYEWAVALTRDITERRAFLFVLLLDDTPLPPDLTCRIVLTAREGLERALDELAGYWRRDGAVRGSVDPPPGQPWPAYDNHRLREFYVRNIFVRNVSWGVRSQVVKVLAEPVTGHRLWQVVREALVLPPGELHVGENGRCQFRYRLVRQGQDIVDDETTLRLRDGDVLDLVIDVDLWKGPEPGGHASYRGYRGGRSPVRDRDRRIELERSFEHLGPPRGR
jgi:hypothetical protein